MPNPAITQELAIGFGKNKQIGTGLTTTTAAQVQTSLLVGSLINLGTDVFSVPFPNFVNEDDGDFFGKSDEFIGQIFPTSVDTPWEWSYHLTSQNFAAVMAFFFGKTVETVPEAGVAKYVSTPLVRGTDGVSLPVTTIVAGIRQATAGEMLDIAAVGMGCESWSLNIKRGPGLQNCTLKSSWKGCGKYINNCGLTIPARLATEARLGAGASTALLLNDVNLLSSARVVDITITGSNNFGPGHFPGSGSQDGYDLRGNMWIGKRVYNVTGTALMEAGSPELTDLIARNEGVGQIKVVGAAVGAASFHTAQIDFHRMVNRSYKMAESDGFVTVVVDYSIMKHATNGIVTATSYTDVAGICAEA